MKMVTSIDHIFLDKRELVLVRKEEEVHYFQYLEEMLLLELAVIIVLQLLQELKVLFLKDTFHTYCLRQT